MLICLFWSPLLEYKLHEGRNLYFLICSLITSNQDQAQVQVQVSCHAKVKCYYENFHKPKWPKIEYPPHPVLFLPLPQALQKVALYHFAVKRNLL